MTRRGDSRSDWLPDFCRLPTLFSSLVAAQLAVLVIAMAPGEGPIWGLRDLVAGSFLALWLALCSAALLCKLRPAIHRLPIQVGAILAWLIAPLVAVLGSSLVYQLDVAPFGIAPLPRDSLIFALKMGGIAALLSAALLRYFFVQEQWLSQERAQSRAAVDALQARIRPHFLFNSMNTIAGLIRREPDTAERVVEDLSDLFRAALGAGPQDWLITEELRLCRRYLAIEELRFGERLRVVWSIMDQVPEVSVPKLLLEPLVENAVHHGISRLAQGGEIVLEMTDLGSSLRIEIRNPVPAVQAAGSGNRHGADSVKQRLTYRFGAKANMTAGRNGGYYVCVIEIPKA